MTVAPKPDGRKIIAMKWGDNCWLRGLTGAPELNGKHVRLEKWIDTKQRWRCVPVGWTYTEEFIGVKPKNLSNEPPENKEEASSSASSSMSGPQLAASLESLMKRGEELRGETIRLFNAKGPSDASLEASIRLGMCQVDLLEIQLQILAKGGTREQVKEAKAKLNQVRKETSVQLKQWRLAGYEPPDYWEPALLADEALVKGDVQKYREALSTRG